MTNYDAWKTTEPESPADVDDDGHFEYCPIFGFDFETVDEDEADRVAGACRCEDGFDVDDWREYNAPNDDDFEGGW